jgi:hypothetical protein
MRIAQPELLGLLGYRWIDDVGFFNDLHVNQRAHTAEG